MRGAFVVALVTLSVGTGCQTAKVDLEHVRGLYTTHFDAIPDSAALCATLTNRGEKDVTWVRLRLRAYSALGDEPARWTSTWIFAEPIAAGETRAIVFRHPPVANEVEISVRRAGNGPAPRRGRRALPAEGCSEAWLTRALEDETPGRTARNVEFHTITDRNDPHEEVVIASQDRR